MKKLFTLLAILLMANTLSAAVYTVGSGKDYSTISGCAAVAVAGDTCDIYTGSYSGWTQSASGSSGSLITFQAHAGESVTLTSGITISSQSYIHITGLNFSSGYVTGNATTTHNTIDYNTFTSVGFTLPSGQSTATDNAFAHNTIAYPNHNSNVRTTVYGDRNLLEYNTISGSGGDCFNAGGANLVIRYNYCHDMDGSVTGEHLDFVQVIGGTSPTLSYSLIEQNVEKNCINDGGNCHFLMIRASGGQVGDTLILRYNYAYNMDGSFAGIGYHGDGTATVPNAHVYNNTVATEANLGSGSTGPCGTFDSGYGVMLNQICYNTAAGPYTPMYFGQGGYSNADIAYQTGYSGSWNSPYSSETTYGSLHNANPQFANYPADGTLSVGSPAITGGVALTTVASGDSGSGTSLIVNDSRFFQAYNYGAVQPDWIRVGASTTVQISSINYSTDTITLANSISRSVSDPVYLYKDSTGAIVLPGTSPDIGAFPYGGSPSSTTTITGAFTFSGGSIH